MPVSHVNRRPAGRRNEAQSRPPRRTFVPITKLLKPMTLQCFAMLITSNHFVYRKALNYFTCRPCTSERAHARQTAGCRFFLSSVRVRVRPCLASHAFPAINTLVNYYGLRRRRRQRLSAVQTVKLHTENRHVQDRVHKCFHPSSLQSLKKVILILKLVIVITCTAVLLYQIYRVINCR